MVTPVQHRAQLTKKRTERLRQVAQLRLAGVRDQQTIADRLGVDRTTISRDFAALDARWRVEAAADIDAAKGQDLERLEAMLLGLWQEATKGRWLAVDRVLHILERRAAIYGYDAPKRSELTGADGGAIEIDHGGLPDTERAERLAALFNLVRSRLTVPPGEAEPVGALARPADDGVPQ